MAAPRPATRALSLRVCCCSCASRRSPGFVAAHRGLEEEGAGAAWSVHRSAPNRRAKRRRPLRRRRAKRAPKRWHGLEAAKIKAAALRRALRRRRRRAPAAKKKHSGAPRWGLEEGSMAAAVVVAAVPQGRNQAKTRSTRLKSERRGAAEEAARKQFAKEEAAEDTEIPLAAADTAVRGRQRSPLAASARRPTCDSARSSFASERAQEALGDDHMDARRLRRVVEAAAQRRLAIAGVEVGDLDPSSDVQAHAPRPRSRPDVCAPVDLVGEYP